MPSDEFTPHAAVPARSQRRVFDTDFADYADAPVYSRADLLPGMTVAGPAVITEEQTTTIVSRHFDARINGLGYIDLTRKNAS